MEKLRKFLEMPRSHKVKILRRQFTILAKNFNFYGHENTQHWSKFFSAPTCQEVLELRENQIRSRLKTPIDTYEKVISHYLSSKKILDFGAANHGNITNSKPTIHDIVCKYASKVIAFDIVPIPPHNKPHKYCKHRQKNLLSPINIKILPKYNIDIFFAGHVIEHLSNPGALYKAAGRVLLEGGKLLIVTPNPLWYVGLLARNKGSTFSINPDHTCIFSASELVELAERFGFKLIEWCYAGAMDMSVRLDTNFLESLRYSNSEIEQISENYGSYRIKNEGFAHNSIVAFFEKT